MTKSEIVNEANRLRGLIGTLDDDVLALKDNIAAMPKAVNEDKGEALANATLTHRLLEDARMRLGKVIQSLEGGVSILDHPEVKALIQKIRSEE